MTFTFKPAKRSESKLRLGLSGPSGAGKTFSALVIASTIAAATGDKIAVIDSEHGSAGLYADEFAFDMLRLGAPYSPERYVDAIHAAEAAGYGIVIIDSITHEWKGVGGILEIVDQLARNSSSGNSYAAWAKADPRHRRFIDAMLTSKAHIIATMRSKTAYVEAEGRNGKKTYQKAGMAAEQRDGIEYEFTLVFDLADAGRSAVASKDRTGLFRDPTVITPETGETLMGWLNSAQAPDPEPEPEPERQPTRQARQAQGARTAPRQADNHGEDPQDSGSAPARPEGAKLPAEDYDRLCLALEACETPQALDRAWTAAKKECQKLGDGASYAALKQVMETAAEFIKTMREDAERRQREDAHA